MKVLYIAGWGRSGTTIVDNILGAYDSVCNVGELFYLWRRGLIQRRRCGCGEPLVRCPFWREVLDLAYRGRNPRPKRIAAAQRRAVRVRDARRLSRGQLDEDARHYRNEIAAVYQAVAEVTGAELIVDSSKTPSGAAVLAHCEGTDGYLLHMVRDPRAVAYSWTRPTVQPDRRKPRQMRQHRTAESTAAWLGWNLLVEDLAREAYAGRTRRLRYEDFVADPQPSIEGVLEFAGMPTSGSPFEDERSVKLAASHTVSGNPKRFHTGAIHIKPDDRWRRAQPLSGRLLSTTMALPLLRRYGYPVYPRTVARRAPAGDSDRGE